MLRRSCKVLLSLNVRSFYSKNKSELLGTLHLRFFNYLKENKTFKCDERILKLIQSTDSQSFNAEKSQQIDRECLKNIGRISNDEVYGLVDALIQVMPYEVGRLRSYPEALQVMISDFKQNPNKETFVRLCFYLGQLKKKSPGPQTLSSLVKEHVSKFIYDMSTMDVSIVAAAAYKAGVRIHNKSFSQRLISEITSTETVDGFIFITLIKGLRQNKVNSLEVFEKLRQLKNSNRLDHLDATSMVHTFMLFADNLIKDDDMTAFFIENSVNSMDGIETRAKDAQKLLYSCALLNVSMKPEHLQKLEQLLVARTDHAEYEKKFDNFVDAALSMWMLNHRPKTLFMKLLSDSRLHQTGDKSRIKLDSRKKLLLTCVEIEEPQWIEHINRTSPSFDAHRSAPPYLIKPSIKKVERSFRKHEVKIVQQIRHLNIAGIFVKKSTGQNFHAEVLDDSNTLSDNESPNGILALKLRLLKQKGCKVMLIRPLLK